METTRMISTLATATLLTLSAPLQPANAQPPVMQADAEPNEIVNPQITDAVTEADAPVLGDAATEPEEGLTPAFESVETSPPYAQNQQNVLAQAATTQGAFLEN
ncbi:hypothetical protein RMQ97_05155 [Maricaulis sp. D1M11]|uniref:hypothetical protein n=1 Tax=Maricaulis sp. D1M11 TaxID=3076117 RepID=UPI0039B5E6A6